MSEESHDPLIDPELEARIVALVLGESSDFESDELRRLIEKRPELATFKDQIESVHRGLHGVETSESIAEDEDWKLSPERRNTVLAVMRGSAKGRSTTEFVHTRAKVQALAKATTFQKLVGISAVLCVAVFCGMLAFPMFTNRHRQLASLAQQATDNQDASESTTVDQPTATGKLVTRGQPRLGYFAKARLNESTNSPSGLKSDAAVENDRGFRPPTQRHSGRLDDGLETIAEGAAQGAASSVEADSRTDRRGGLPKSAHSSDLDLSFSSSQFQDQRQQVQAQHPPSPQFSGGTPVHFSTDSIELQLEEEVDANVDANVDAGVAVESGRGLSDRKRREPITVDETPRLALPQPRRASTSERGGREGFDASVLIPDGEKPSEDDTKNRPESVLRSKLRSEPRSGSERTASSDVLAKESKLTDLAPVEDRFAEQDKAALGLDNGRTRDRYEASIQRETFEPLARLRASQPRDALQTVPSGLAEDNAETAPFSTFSLHVSDVSFKLAQAALARGAWPESEQVRLEEFVNAFDYGDPMPSQHEKVACIVEQSIHPFLQQRNLLRVSLRTAAAGRASSMPLRLTFLLDNSGSMERLDRKRTVRRAFSLLAQQLTQIDEVTLISFARQPRLLADKVNGSEAQRLVQLIDDLPSEGGTNIEAALRLAFEKAQEYQVDVAQHRIILLTDGAVNLGDADPEHLSNMITTIRETGVAFDAAGISADGLNDEILEALTRKGDGRYYLLDSVESADDDFSNQIAGALHPSAKNVKVQIEFNPRRVGRYKLLGFEQHRLKTEDFRNDNVDAAELAAAESGVAVYQFEAKADGEGDVGSVSVRFRDLSTGRMIENRWPIPYEADATRLDQAAPSLRIAASAALLAAKLKGEPLGGTVDLKTLSDLVSGLPEPDRTVTRVQQLQQMIQHARQMIEN